MKLLLEQNMKGCKAMNGKKLKHDDCMNFATVDAAKGICRKTNQLIFTDTDVCENLQLMPKCKNCINFKNADKESIGVCHGLEKQDWSYGELAALNCEGYNPK
jgi:4-hydroxyphenylacetate decarboxylase small subunit